ncbi:MAG: hypothetical protein SNJ67_09090 [Chloracidobacterium sp.]|uniref:Uncharacterized protein n=1 Tax=Chloracidobacterium validum TaxID=2821543 RepID=A0ABX8B5H1_9BACT|nr:hypothetical protein [Chloracidobacterium validum]QUW02178.1 hypothetical protein J8C06_07340 [Chloracidobacterium validum]
MSVKLTALLFMLLCLEVGLLLAIIPWTSYWESNYFLFWLTARFPSTNFTAIVQSGYVRGAVTGIGLANIALGLLEVSGLNLAGSRAEA